MKRDAALGPIGDIGVVSNHDYGGSLAMQLLEERQDLVCSIAVEGPGRLIGEDQCWHIYQCPSDCDALLLASRKLAWPMIFAMTQADTV
jgi:hypothetical protein